MAVLSTTKMSSKGQVVIPDEVRKALHLDTGAQFVVHGEGDTLILKRLQSPSLEDLKPLLEGARRAARAEGLKKSDVRKAIKEARRRR
jgi:AbrB family looped-hinge helix DNA binding protein